MQALDLKSYIKNIKKALKYDHLYSDEELRKMKSDLRNLQKTKEMLRTYQNNGFGQYLMQPVKFDTTIPEEPPQELIDAVETVDDVKTVDAEVVETIE